MVRTAVGPTATAEEGRPPYDLRAGSPDLSAFPRSGWLAAMRRALSSTPYETLGYCDPQGLPELRRALAGYLSRARGVMADSDRIVVCSGFTQGLGLLCHVLRARGAATLAIEAYSQPSHRAVAGASGLNLEVLAVDGLGAAVDELGSADAVLLTPAHQFPLGVALGPQRRTQVIEWAQASSGVVIEDDYDGEFRYDRQPVGAVQALAPEHVIYAGSVSKSLAPGLRVGWLVLPGHLVDDVVAAKALADRQSSTLDQLGLAERCSGRGHRCRSARAVGTARRSARRRGRRPCGPPWPGHRSAPPLQHLGPARPSGPGRRLRHAARTRVHRGRRSALRSPQ